MFKIIDFNIVISDSDWDTLIYFLSQKDNKIFGLDFSKPDLKSYFKKFLEVMGTDNLYLYIDSINFGKVSISTRKLIKLANFLLTYYSEDLNPMPSNMFNYVFLKNDGYMPSRILKLKKNQLREKHHKNQKLHKGNKGHKDPLYGYKFNKEHGKYRV